VAKCVAVLGLGRMGSAIAERYHDEGYHVVLWNRTLKKAEDLAARLGGDVVSTPRDAVDRCDRLHVVVADDEASYSVIAGVNGLTLRDLSGKVIYNHSTVTPRHTLQMIEAVRSSGGVYVEAPIIGGPSVVRQGRALILCGGAEPDYCEHLHVLGETVYMGGAPRATAAKLAYNITFLAVIGGLAEAAALAAAYGIPFREFNERILSKTWIGKALERYKGRLEPGHPASFTARLAGKDARYAMKALHEKGLSGMVAAAVAAYYAEMDGEGLGEEDYPSLVGFMEEKARRRGRG
jgi:3-hydroxyisobutyrate dehydrogenase